MGQSNPRSVSSGVTATPPMSGCHSRSKQYTYWAGSEVAWKPLHTPAGTRTCTPGTRDTVSTLPTDAESGRTSTYAPNAWPEATPTSLTMGSPCMPRIAPCRVSVTFSCTQGPSEETPAAANADSR